jgi:two-component system, OmpR family, sensor histidine kinase VicK
VVRKVLQFISNTMRKFDVCIDHTRPSLAFEIQEIKESLIACRSRGIRIRIITEVTTDNISYCKELAPMVDELRHLDGIKGNFYVNETEYLVPASFHDKGKPAEEIIYSNLEELVEHQQYVFDTLWNKSIPVEEKIMEIQEGITSPSLEIIPNVQEAAKRSWDLARSARDEIFVKTATANGFRRQLQRGMLQEINEFIRQRPNVKIKFLIPADEKIKETVENSKLECPQVDFRIFEESLNTGIGIEIVDKKECMMIAPLEKDDAKMDYRDFSGLSLYSNNKSIVLSLASIIESYWKQTELYEQSKEQLHAAEDELANMKEYLNEVLKEVSNMRNKQVQ